MKHVFAAWPLAFRYLFKDPVNLMLFLIPATLAIVLYAILGGYFMSSALQWAEALIMQYVISKEASVILYYLVSGLLMFLFYLMVSWTFILCIGILSAPFNDMISRRIEIKLRGETQEQNKSKTLTEVFKSLGRILFTELKKILVIITLTVIATVLNFFPLFYPVALAMLALLMSAQYLDFTWSRHEMSATQCFRELFSFAPSNIVSGLMFLGLIAIPFINALVPAIATSYYTVLWNKRQQLQLSV
jgi:uncharacterized protein involved in cysteine biosynthesis